jgi:hypothetical protein
MDEGRGIKRRWALAVLLGWVALLVLAPSALATTGTSTISGTVTEAGSNKELKNIEVTVYEANGKESFVGFATTEANGGYTVEALPKGEYKVEFSGDFEGLNYVTQFYEGATSLSKAKPVVIVTEGETQGNIDAALEVGGEVSGAVTDALTHKALSNAVVVALVAGEAGEVVDGLAITNESGQYTIVGLASGSYKIGVAGSGYVTQYYNDEPSFASANPISVVQKSAVLGIDAALMPKAPINTVAPVASGTPAAGQTLLCTSGSWTGTPAPTFTYAWLHDGVPIVGATGRTYVVQAADQGNGLTCKVTATNKSGSVAAVSNTLIVPVPPPPPPPAPIVELSSSKLVVSGGSARMPIVCAGTTCTGTIELTGKIVVKYRKGKRTLSKKQTVVLAKGSYSLAAGKSATIVIRLTAKGRSALARAKGHKLSADASVTVTGGTTVKGSVVLRETVKVKPKLKRGK